MTVRTLCQVWGVDRPIRHLNQLLLGSREFRTAALHERRIDVYLAHVVHNDRDSPPFSIVEHSVEKRGLASPEEARQNGYREARMVRNGLFIQGHRNSRLIRSEKLCFGTLGLRRQSGVQGARGCLSQ